MSCREIVTSLSFFQFMANLEQSESRIPDTEHVTHTFSLAVTFYLTKTDNRTKKSLIQLSHYCFEYRYQFCQKMHSFCKKNADIRKAKRTLVLKGIFSETTNVCVLMYQIPSFQHNSNEFQKEEGVLFYPPPPPPPPQSEPLKSPPRLGLR